MKIILIDSSYPINSRNLRILNTLKNKYDVGYLTWRRDNTSIQSDDLHSRIYNKDSKYGNRIFKAINFYGYYRFIKQNIEIEKPGLIIASHWDMLFIASLLKRKNQFKIVYENLDMPDSDNLIVKLLMRALEKKVLKVTDGIILASRFFSPYYNHTKQLIYENYTIESAIGKNIQIKRKNNMTNIAFLGNIRHYEIIKNLISAFCDNDKFEIDLFGTGLAEDKLKKFCIENSVANVHFHGRYNYSDINKIYLQVDYVWAAYPSNSFNVKHAISNKFFEVIANNKIAIFAENTKLGELVINKNIGLVVNPYSPESIRSKIIDFDKSNKMDAILAGISEFKKEEKVYWDENENRLIQFIHNI